MREINFLKTIINDILSSEAYSMAAIGYYTNTNEDIISEILLGKNNSPSFELTRRIIDLHISIRKDWYKKLLQKLDS